MGLSSLSQFAEGDADVSKRSAIKGMDALSFASKVMDRSDSAWSAETGTITLGLFILCLSYKIYRVSLKKSQIDILRTLGGFIWR